MPDTLTAPPPSATVKEVRIVEGAAPKPPPAPTRTLTPAQLAAMPTPGGDRPGADPKPSTFRERLEKHAKPAGDQTVVPTPVNEPKPETKPDGAEGADPGEGGEVEATPPKPAAGEVDPKTGKPKKANPWKLFDEEKKARALAEQEVQRIKREIVPEQERTAIMERVTKAEARARELEDHIRFVSYEKSAEFQEKYQAPYEAAFRRATNELSGITIIDPQTNQPRGVTAEDMLELVNLPLGQAREVADAVFGKFADDAMAHRKEIKSLFDIQVAALEDARKNTSTRMQQHQEQVKRQQAEVSKFVKTAWDEANTEFQTDKVNGEYFKPKVIAEGAEPTPEEKDWNDSLARGFKLVDEAWSQNAMDPKLTPEQRKDAIRKNAAVRNRAAAFGPLKRLLNRTKSENERLKKELAAYTASTPAAGGSSESSGGGSSSGSAKDGMLDRLRKYAH